MDMMCEKVLRCFVTWSCELRTGAQNETCIHAGLRTFVYQRMYVRESIPQKPPFLCGLPFCCLAADHHHSKINDGFSSVFHDGGEALHRGFRHSAHHGCWLLGFDSHSPAHTTNPQGCPALRRLDAILALGCPSPAREPPLFSPLHVGDSCSLSLQPRTVQQGLVLECRSFLWLKPLAEV